NYAPFPPPVRRENRLQRLWGRFSAHSAAPPGLWRNCPAESILVRANDTWPSALQALRSQATRPAARSQEPRTKPVSWHLPPLPQSNHDHQARSTNPPNIQADTQPKRIAAVE